MTTDIQIAGIELGGIARRQPLRPRTGHRHGAHRAGEVAENALRAADVAAVGDGDRPFRATVVADDEGPAQRPAGPRARYQKLTVGTGLGAHITIGARDVSVTGNGQETVAQIADVERAGIVPKAVGAGHSGCAGRGRVPAENRAIRTHECAVADRQRPDAVVADADAVGDGKGRVVDDGRTAAGGGVTQIGRAKVDVGIIRDIESAGAARAEIEIAEHQPSAADAVDIDAAARGGGQIGYGRGAALDIAFIDHVQRTHPAAADEEATRRGPGRAGPADQGIADRIGAVGDDAVGARHGGAGQDVEIAVAAAGGVAAEADIEKAGGGEAGIVLEVHRAGRCRAGRDVHFPGADSRTVQDTDDPASAIADIDRPGIGPVIAGSGNGRRTRRAAVPSQ